MPFKHIVPRDLHSRSLRSEHRKMRLLISAVIARAKEKGEWEVGNGAWDVARAVRLFNSVKDLFEYSSLTSTRRNDPISWRTVHILYIKSVAKERGCGRGHRRRRDSNEGGTMSGGEEQCDAIKE